MTGVLIVGVGPGIAASVARRFALGGYAVGLISRSRASTEPVASAVMALGQRVATETADATEESALIAAIDRVVEQLGVPDVVVYNAGLIQADRPGQLTHSEHQAAYAVNVLGALTTAAHLGPRMADNGGGTIIITGGMPQPVPALVSLSLGKAAVRALTELLDQEYGPHGVHVATVTVCGAVAPGTLFDPDRIAGDYWRLHTQPPERWEREIVFTGSPA